MNDIDGSFLKCATGPLIAIFTTIFGSHKYTQSQIDKHKAATDKIIGDHKEEVKESLSRSDCVQKTDCKEDREHLATHMKRMEGVNKSIFAEIKSLNDKLFDVVKEK